MEHCKMLEIPEFFVHLQPRNFNKNAIMRKNILLLGLLSCFLTVYAQKPVELSDISMINLGDGRLYATSTEDM
jgi:hypothetical protein